MDNTIMHIVLSSLGFHCGTYCNVFSCSQSTFCPTGIQSLPFGWFWYLSGVLGHTSSCGVPSDL